MAAAGPVPSSITSSSSKEDKQEAGAEAAAKKFAEGEQA